jgi:hypothetical protein
MARAFPLRLAAAFGWIGFVGVAGGLIALPTAIAGQPPTMNTPLADVLAYFRHGELVALTAVVSVFVAGLPILPFGLGLREITGSSRGQAMADLGFLVLVITLPIYVVSDAIGAALTTAASGDPGTFASLHALYQLLYNGAADVLEGAWIGAFSIAALWAPVPRWFGWLGLALAASRWVKAFVPVAAVPEAIIPVSGVLFVAWFLAAVILVTRRAMAGEASTVAVATAG